MVRIKPVFTRRKVQAPVISDPLLVAAPPKAENQKVIGKVNVVIGHVKERVPNKRQPKVLSEITLRLGDEPIARRTIPGKWSEQQVLTEFRRFPARFLNVSKFDEATLLAIVG